MQFIPFLDDCISAPGDTNQNETREYCADYREASTTTHGQNMQKPARRGIEKRGEEQSAEDHQ
jgi:hypothetical protein